MKNIVSTLVLIIIVSLQLVAQKKANDIVFIVDELRTAWDIEALKMESYEGMKEYCHSKPYRNNVLDLLRQIHHYDTTLYFTVTDKYDANADAAAKETLDDIMTLEVEYTNKKFVAFLKKECDKVISIEKNLAKKDSGGFDKDIAALEEELIQYIDAVTERVDLVDEHIHHLKELNPEILEVPKEKNEGTGF
ncbi:MAG: hypothetical protein ABJH98_08240 [Reichenbachiella sp.]|uniref:hypothetical protein n=1 Tax=Reichenbachiella sp. TaxID=2184521 RepID=UPI0032989A84